MRRLLLLVACTAGVAACGGATPPPFKPIADNKLLMESVIDPNADIVWDSVRTVMTLDGTEEFRPHTDAEWTVVRNSAVALAESGNLLMMVPRAKDGGEWMKAARGLIETSEAAIRAIDAKNAEQLFTAGGDIYNACSNCHSKYLEEIVKANTN